MPDKKRLEAALDFAKGEIRSYEIAPRVNGCGMTGEWQEMIDLFCTIRDVLEQALEEVQ